MVNINQSAEGPALALPGKAAGMYLLWRSGAAYPTIASNAGASV